MKKYLALALMALSLASFTSCSKEPAQPESNMENTDTLADFKAQVIESSGVETTKAHIEVMNADGEGLIYFAEI